MAKDIEELKFVADLAHNGGVMQAQNEALKAEIESLKAENKSLKAENKSLKAENKSLKAEVKHLSETNDKQQQLLIQKDQMIAEGIHKPVVVVNKYYLLSVPKTCQYVSTLDNDGRRFVGHFMHHTLSDGTPMSVIEQVDEMTQLEASQDGRLAGAIEELASRPTTQNTYQAPVGQVLEHVEKVDHINNDRDGKRP